MKSKIILALWLGASAWAQTLPQKQQVNPPVAAKPKTGTALATSAQPTKAHTPANTAKSGAPAVAKPKAATRHLVAGSGAVKPPAQVSATSAQSSSRPRKRPAAKIAIRSSYVKPGLKESTAPQVTTASAKVSGRRDPFVSPVVERALHVSSCTGSGRQCLLVSEITLHGVVRSPSGFIAVVVNGEHTYFLRENDPLADGAVERITKDAIILRERSSDALGRSQTREVIRKLGVPAV